MSSKFSWLKEEIDNEFRQIENKTKKKQGVRKSTSDTVATTHRHGIKKRKRSKATTKRRGSTFSALPGANLRKDPNVKLEQNLKTILERNSLPSRRSCQTILEQNAKEKRQYDKAILNEYREISKFGKKNKKGTQKSVLFSDKELEEFSKAQFPHSKVEDQDNDN